MRYLFLFFVAAPALMTTGCESRVSLVNTTAGAGGATPIVCEPHTWGRTGEQPPDGPSAERLPDGRGLTLAISELDFGVDSGWQALGFNLDDHVTDSGEGPCAPLSGSTGQQDGQNGIDNAFGHHVVPMLETMLDGFQERVNLEIEAGRFSYLFAIEALGEESRYYPVVTRLYQGADLGEAPDFDGKDNWPIRGDSLLNPSDIESAKNTLHCSYLSDDVWVSEPMPALDIELRIDETNALALHLREVVVSMDIDANRKSASGGRLGGMITVDDLADAIVPIMDALGEDICDAKIYEDFLDELRQAADVRIGAKSGGSCNALSVGLGFNAKSARLGSVALAPPPKPNPCTEGATGSPSGP